MKNMLNRLKEKQNKKGFTLVEIIVVLVILAILAAIAIPAVLGYVEDAKKTQYIAEARSIYMVLQTEEAKYEANNGYTNPNQFDYDRFLRNEKIITQNGQEGIIYKKTGLKNSYVLYRDDKYYIGWKSDNGNYILAWVTKNKNVEIESITKASN